MTRLFYLFFIVAMLFSPAFSEANSGDFDGGVAIGSSYAGVDSAPTNGLIVQGNVGIGTGTNSPLAQLDVRGVVGSTGIIAGYNALGVSLVENWPGVYFNAYFNTHPLFMSTGYAGAFSLVPTTGDMQVELSSASGTAGGTVTFHVPIEIKNNGNVGIGNTSPSYLLHVGSSSASGIVMELQNSSGACTYNPGASSVTVSCSSDVRLKSDIQDAKGALTWVDDMRVRDFTVKATGGHKTGVIAQEVAVKHPEMVHEGAEGTYLVDEPNPWKLVKAIQEQQNEIDALKRTIEQLKQQR